MALTKIPVGDSDAIQDAYYDPERKVIRIVFKKTNKHYEYSGVEASKANAFIQSESKGKWARENLGNIRGVPQHPFSVVPPLDEGQA